MQAMAPRERLDQALDHKKPDCVPLGLGARAATGMAYTRNKLVIWRPVSHGKLTFPLSLA